MFLSRDQAREVDRRSAEAYHLPGLLLMENASRGVADAAGEELQRRLGRSVGEILILCGGGNNGGDGLAAARHLHNRGCPIQIALAVDPANYRGDAAANWKIIQAMHLPTSPLSTDWLRRQRPQLIIDALFGTGLRAEPRPPFADWVRALEQMAIPLLAVDLPSGLDCDSGLPLGAAAIRATRTVTFVAMKQGFANPASRAYTGQVTIADIGCPRELIAALASPNADPAVQRDSAPPLNPRLTKPPTPP